MSGFRFEAECCPEGWEMQHADQTGAMSRVWVRCAGCGGGRVITASWRDYKTGERTLLGVVA